MSRRKAPRWAAALHRTAGRIVGGWADPGGDGRRRPTFRLNVAIDLHKAATGVFVLVLMQAYGVFTSAAWVYLALHGSYGIAWVVKDAAVGDRKWRRRVGLGGLAGTWAFLSLYWVAPLILVVGSAGNGGRTGWTPADGAWLGVAIVAYVVGLVLMVGADAQKNAALASRGPGGSTATPPPADGLITTGFFARTRHPNYLGEMLIYGSFALVAGHWVPWLILAAIWGLFFLPNMYAIEESLSRYPDYEAWRERTGFLLPRIRGRAPVTDRSGQRPRGRSPRSADP